MSKNAWLTKNSIPSGRVSYILTLPDDEAWRADFLGAFLLLTKEENWEQFETLTPTEMADEWLELFLDFESESLPMIPPGLISPFAGAAAPAGWLLCNGQAVSRTTYADLFALVDLTYGFGDGSTTFNVPNLVGNVVVGRDASQAEFDYLGEPGGSKTHTLTTAQMPSHGHVQDSHNHTQNSHGHVQDSHNHTQNSHSHTQDSHLHTQVAHAHGQIGKNVFAAGGNYGADTVGGFPLGTNTNSATPTINGSVATNQATTPTNVAATATNQATTPTNIAATATNQNTGGGGAHNNLQPYLVLNYIIKT